MRFENTYLPLLPYVVAAAAWAGRVSPAHAFHFVAAFFYCMGPAALFLFLRRLSGQMWPSFFAALLYSLASPAGWMVREIAFYQQGIWNPRRLLNLVYHGEAPHIAALALVPLALLFVLRAMEERLRRDTVLAVVLSGAVVLTNSFGAVTLVLTTLCLGVTRMRRIGRAVAIGVAAYALICALLPPSVLRVISQNSATIGGDYRFAARNYVALGALAVSLAALAFISRRIPNPATRFFLLVAPLYAAIVLLFYRANLAVIPQPSRYHLELELAFWGLAVFGFADLVRSPRWRVISATAAIGFAIFEFAVDRRFARELIQPVEITKTIEYKTARWMDQHVPGSRALISGDEGFWYNVFTDNAQLSSGLEASNPNPMQAVAVYTIYSGSNAGPRDAAISLTWLKAFGCAAVTVPGPGSSEAYKPIVNLRKFEGVLRVLWREGDDTIYGAPSRSMSLAHVIPESAIVRRTPIHGLDTEPLEAYVAALDDPAPPLAEMRWLSTDRAHISTRAMPGQVVAVQVTYDPGWHARVEGKDVPVAKDAIGLMVIRPECSGGCEIDFSFEAAREIIVCRVVSGATILLLLAYLAGTRLRRDESRRCTRERVLHG